MEFAIFQVWTFSDKSIKTIWKNHGNYSLKSLKIPTKLKECLTNCKKTIPMSILKLARDKKSKHEPKKEARGADLH